MNDEFELSSSGIARMKGEARSNRALVGEILLGLRLGGTLRDRAMTA